MSRWNPFRRRKLDAQPGKDARSRDYSVRSVIPPDAKPCSRTWACGAYLDQGREGACTGFAVAHELAAEPICVDADNHLALSIYREAQKVDRWPGEDYSGSSVLAAMKVATKLGHYSEYRWAFSLDDLILAVCHCGPAVISVNWYKGMSRTNPSGFIAPVGKRTGRHAICVIGYNASMKAFQLRNSWGRRWGCHGDCWILEADMGHLLREGGEACIPMVREQTA
jgi:hypothetical protein